MNRLSAFTLLAALLALGGCAAPGAVDFDNVSARDRHGYMPGPAWDLRPLVVVTAGSDGLLVGTGPGVPPPAVAALMQDGQGRLVSRQTLAAMSPPAGTGAMGASPATPAAPSAPAPSR
jgi:hypothetical protein